MMRGTSRLRLPYTNRIKSCIDDDLNYLLSVTLFMLSHEAAGKYLRRHLIIPSVTLLLRHASRKEGPFDTPLLLHKIRCNSTILR